MAEESPAWWKRNFLKRKKSESVFLYDPQAEPVSNAASSQHGSGVTAGVAAHKEETVLNSQLNTQLERILDKTTANNERLVKVSHSGRFKEKKKVRASLGENPEMFPGSDTKTDKSQRAGT